MDKIQIEEKLNTFNRYNGSNYIICKYYSSADKDSKKILPDVFEHVNSYHCSDANRNFFYTKVFDKKFSYYLIPTDSDWNEYRFAQRLQPVTHKLVRPRIIGSVVKLEDTGLQVDCYESVEYPNVHCFLLEDKASDDTPILQLLRIDTVNDRIYYVNLSQLNFDNNHFTLNYDFTFHCADCGNSYNLSSGEIAWYKNKDWNLPRRCPTCRAARKK